MSDEEGYTQEEMREIADAVRDVFDALTEMNDPSKIMMVLASCTSMVLCSGMSSAEEASEEFKKFQLAVGRSVDHARSIGITMWDCGSAH